MRALPWILILAALGLSGAQARDYQAGSLQIGQPWARATPHGAKVGSGYLRITNTGPAPDRLVGATLSIARRVEIHEMSMDRNVMKMRALPNGLEIKPGATVELKPGSFHMMFHDLARPLVKGNEVTGTLVFEKAGTVEIKYAVEAIGANAPGHGGGGGHGSHHH